MALFFLKRPNTAALLAEGAGVFQAKRSFLSVFRRFVQRVLRAIVLATKGSGRPSSKRSVRYLNA